MKIKITLLLSVIVVLGASSQNAQSGQKQIRKLVKIEQQEEKPDSLPATSEQPGESKSQSVLTDQPEEKPESPSVSRLRTDELAPFMERKKWGLKNKITGKVAVEAIYDKIDMDRGNGFFLVGIVDKGYGFLDSEGNVIVPPKYNAVSSTPRISTDGSFTYSTSYVVEKMDKLETKDYLYFVDGLAVVGNTVAKNETYFGYIDEQGNELTQMVYSQALPLVEGMAPVIKKGSGIGFIDKTGKEVIPCIYENGTFFKDGECEVQLNGKSFKIDKTGKKIE